MKKVLVGLAIAAALNLTACSSMATQSNDSYDAVVADATATHAEAKSMDNVWKQKKMKMGYVEHYLDLAAKAKAKGDDAAALKWAKEAQKSAHAEVAQMKENENLKAAWEK
ncbi:MAG: hypothetical protein R3189_03470 [Thiomicrorhabdus chilensis]|uniref:hypothetical protein n=1 Tax=Thiomicrorhabdus chilensis TaxID=63656 RepID=UPI00048FAA35|nr:hypothetical protein [Thiomicrorhabdus chilensis]MDX1347292.1 hypothetical protein [Thiomicrorhabdus chilensis]